MGKKSGQSKKDEQENCRIQHNKKVKNYLVLSALISRHFSSRSPPLKAREHHKNGNFMLSSAVGVEKELSLAENIAAGEITLIHSSPFSLHFCFASFFIIQQIVCRV